MFITPSPQHILGRLQPPHPRPLDQLVDFPPLFTVIRLYFKPCPPPPSWLCPSLLPLMWRSSSSQPGSCSPWTEWDLTNLCRVGVCSDREGSSRWGNKGERRHGSDWGRGGGVGAIWQDGGIWHMLPSAYQCLLLTLGYTHTMPEHIALYPGMFFVCAMMQTVV